MSSGAIQTTAVVFTNTMTTMKTNILVIIAVTSLRSMLRITLPAHIPFDFLYFTCERT